MPVASQCATALHWSNRVRHDLEGVYLNRSFLRPPPLAGGNDLSAASSTRACATAEKDGQTVTAGGRVLGATAIAPDRQGLRHGGFCDGVPPCRRDAAHLAKRASARRQRDLHTNNAAHRLRVSQRKGKQIEECFGWLKDIALLRRLRLRGLPKVGRTFTFAAAACNLVRMRNLRMPSPQTA